MNLTIGDPVPATALANRYSVEIEVMSGDGDDYSHFTVFGFQPGVDEDILENLLRLLDRLREFYPHGRGGGEEYSYTRVPGFEAWFSSSSVDHAGEEWLYTPKSEDEWTELIDLGKSIEVFQESVRERALRLQAKIDAMPEWPSDVTMLDAYDCHGEASFQSYRVFFHDENLVKREVQVSF